MKHLALFALAACPLLVMASDEGSERTARIRDSATVLNDAMRASDNGIPQNLLEKAYCVGIVPDLKRAGFIVAGKYGKGVLTCRLPDKRGWSAPSTIRIEGGSVGLQIGAGETDLVFIVMSRKGMDKLMQDKFTFGADASVMGGPVGRSAEARTDAMMHAEILAWSRSRGAFAGVSLGGATLRPDKSDNDAIYGRPVTQRAILTGAVQPTQSAKPLFSELNRYAPYRKS